MIHTDNKFKKLAEFKTEAERADWVLTTAEKSTNRYIEAERFLQEIKEMTLFERIFCGSKISKFLQSRSKYNF